MSERDGTRRGGQEPLTEDYFLHRYLVTKVYEMSARDEGDARRQADFYHFKFDSVEKIQDRSVPYQAYLLRIEEDEDE